MVLIKRELIWNKDKLCNTQHERKIKLYTLVMPTERREAMQSTMYI